MSSVGSLESEMRLANNFNSVEFISLALIHISILTNSKS